MNASRKRARTSRTAAWAAAFAAMVAAAAVAYVVTAGLDGVKAIAGSDPPAIAVDVKGVSSLSGAIVPGDRAEVSSDGVPPSPQDQMPEGGVVTDGGSAIVLKVFGRVDAPVLVLAIRAVDVACERPTGSWTWLETGGGGAYVNYPLEVDLSQGVDSDAVPLSFNGEDWAFPRQVSQAEAEGYEVKVSAPEGTICNLRLNIDYEAADGLRRQIVADLDGQPFAIADERVAEESIGYNS